MLGIVVELFISWLLLWFFNKKSLSVLGLGVSGGRLLQLLFGFLMAASCCAIYYYFIHKLSGSSIRLNENYSMTTFLNGAGWTLKSVIFEELIFRGALLYMAIEKAGKHKAVAFSAIAFGVYHWFSYGLIGQPVQMIYVFILTGVAGFMFACAFAETRSLYLPVGLHFGWNLVTIAVLSQGPLGDQLLMNRDGEPLGTIYSLLFLFFQISVLPLIVYGYLRKLRKTTAYKN